MNGFFWTIPFTTVQTTGQLKRPIYSTYVHFTKFLLTSWKNLNDSLLKNLEFYRFFSLQISDNAASNLYSLCCCLTLLSCHFAIFFSTLYDVLILSPDSELNYFDVNYPRGHSISTWTKICPFLTPYYLTPGK